MLIRSQSTIRSSRTTRLSVLTATGGAVNLTLDQLFKEYEVQDVFIGEVRGFERSQVYGFEPRDGSNASEARFRQYSYIEIKFRVVPQKTLHGTTDIGKPMNLTFKEPDFSGAVTLKEDGTTEDTGPTVRLLRVEPVDQAVIQELEELLAEKER